LRKPVELTFAQILQKLEAFCAYQERCHTEVTAKLKSIGASLDESERVIVHLINNDFLNEERFARAFARGKHRIKHYGRNRIINELKARNISSRIIALSLEEIPEQDYETGFDILAQKHWETLTEAHPVKKRKKFCDFLLRKGYEPDRVYEKAMELEKNTR
jgi:regulatory protein